MHDLEYENLYRCSKVSYNVDKSKPDEWIHDISSCYEICRMSTRVVYPRLHPPPLPPSPPTSQPLLPPTPPPPLPPSPPTSPPLLPPTPPPSPPPPSRRLNILMFEKPQP